MKRYIINLAVILALLFVPMPQSSGEYTPEPVVDPCREYGYEDMLEDARELQRRYPELIRLGSIGTSVEGRSLLLIELGSGRRNIFINGAIHGSEYITTSYLMYMIETYARAYHTSGTYGHFDLKTLFGGVTFCIIPMVNPDGVNLVQNGVLTVQDPERVRQIAAGDPAFACFECWKANINGVDLNRNFDSNWYVRRPVAAPAAKYFKGYSPASEPETAALIRYTGATMFWAAVNFHSQGAGLYGWDDPNWERYPQLRSMARRILAATGYRKLADTSDTDYGTFAGYVREIFCKPALTVELCDYVSSRPYPDEDFMSVWEPAQTICLIVAEEVMKMTPQEHLVFQDGIFLQAFSDRAHAEAYATRYAHSTVLRVDGGMEALPLCYPTDAAVLINGEPAVLSAYDIQGSHYVRVRDLALLLSGTEKQFDVACSPETKDIELNTNRPYTPVGGELQCAGPSAFLTITAMPSPFVFRLDGLETGLQAYFIGGSNYVRLRDIARVLDIGVTWDGRIRTIVINTSAGAGTIQ